MTSQDRPGYAVVTDIQPPNLSSLKLQGLFLVDAHSGQSEGYILQCALFRTQSDETAPAGGSCSLWQREREPDTPYYFALAP